MVRFLIDLNGLWPDFVPVRVLSFRIPVICRRKQSVRLEYFQKTGLHSHLSIPFRVGGRVIGAIAFASFKQTRAWPDDLIARIKLVGEVFAHAIARKREHEKLKAALSEIKLLKDRLERENIYLRHAAEISRPQGLTSHSPGFRAVIEEVAQVAPTNSTVLLQGETGSGKEVLAQAIHNASTRNSRPMVKVNCAALPASLIESRTVRSGKGCIHRGAGAAAGPLRNRRWFHHFPR